MCQKLLDVKNNTPRRWPPRNSRPSRIQWRIVFLIHREPNPRLYDDIINIVIKKKKNIKRQSWNQGRHNLVRTGPPPYRENPNFPTVAIMEIRHCAISPIHTRKQGINIVLSLILYFRKIFTLFFRFCLSTTFLPDKLLRSSSFFNFLDGFRWQNLILVGDRNARVGGGCDIFHSPCSFLYKWKKKPGKNFW